VAISCRFYPDNKHLASAGSGEQSMRLIEPAGTDGDSHPAAANLNG
jgi:hypothetical protein